MSTFNFGGPILDGNLDVGLVRELMTMRAIPAEHYNEAGFFWTWLEAEYGPKAMAVFASQIWKGASPEQIERPFEDAFGVSLEQAVANSAGSPALMFDIIPCAMSSIPTITYEGEPLVLGGDANCQDRDIVSYGTNAVRFMRLELTDEILEEFLLFIEGPMSSSFRLDRCTGSVRPYEDRLFITTYFDEPWREVLGGTYMATVTAEVEADGTINFPRAVITKP